MSLTNPDKLVTEERLNEYHNTILPYLGGMPDILANKFSRGDMYSTEEKIVGTWIDGKPLYQKTCVISDYTGDWDTTHNWSEVGITSNISYIFRVGSLQMHYVSGGDNWWMSDHFHTTSDWASMTCSPSDFRIGTHINAGSIQEVIFTVCYTKTTDSPVAIGIDTDYSTDEKIVGTWIDGKKIYQKTISCGTLPNATAKFIPTGISNFDKPVSIYGIALNTSTGFCIPFPTSNPADASGAIQIAILPNNGAHSIRISSGKDQTSLNVSYVTLRYTKTMD